MNFKGFTVVVLPMMSQASLNLSLFIFGKGDVPAIITPSDFRNTSCVYGMCETSEETPPLYWPDVMSSLMILIWKRHLAHVGWFVGGGGSTGTGWRYHQAYPGAAGTKYHGPWYSIGIVGSESDVLIWGTSGFGFGEDLQKYENNNSNNGELMWSASWYHSIICAYSISIILQSRDFNGETKMIIIMKLRTAMPTYYYLHKEDHSRESKSKSSVSWHTPTPLRCYNLLDRGFNREAKMPINK